MSRLDLPVRTYLLALAVGAAGAFGVSSVLGADAAAPPTPRPPAKSPAKAADAKSPAGSLGKGSGSGPLLTREELRQCMTEQDRMKKETADIVLTQAALARDRAEIDRVSAAIDADRAGVDRSDQAAVDAFNERANARTKLIEAYRAAAPQFNQRVDKLEADQQAYDKACTDRRYDEQDMNAIKAGK